MPFLRRRSIPGLRDRIPIPPVTPEPPASANVGLIVGLSVAAAVVLAGIIVAVVFIVRKKRRG